MPGFPLQNHVGAVDQVLVEDQVVVDQELVDAQVDAQVLVDGPVDDLEAVDQAQAEGQVVVDQVVVDQVADGQAAADSADLRNLLLQNKARLVERKYSARKRSRFSRRIRGRSMQKSSSR